QLPLFQEDQHDRAVVEALLADAPLLGETDREVLEALLLERRKDRDDDLRARRALAFREGPLEAGAVVRAQRVRVVVDARRGGRRNDEGEEEEKCRKQA